MIWKTSNAYCRVLSICVFAKKMDKKPLRYKHFSSEENSNRI